MMRQAISSAPTFCRALSTAPTARRLEGKVALVTASSEGLGFAAAKRVAQEGANVMICSRKQANLDKALEECHREGLTNITGMQCHVSDEEQRQRIVKKTIETFGGIDALVHCAGISPCPGPVLNHTSTAFDKIVDVNLKSSFEFAKLVRPHMKERNGGGIIFLSSVAAYQTTPIQLGLYSVVKLALIGLTKEMAKEVVSENIRVNCIVAGTFKTKYADVIHRTEEFSNAVRSANIMKRDGEPHEMGGATAFLLSDDSSFMTGETLVLAGGLTSGI